MEILVDARGLACPQPVINAKAALTKSSEIAVLVDNETARINVTKMAEKMGAVVKTETVPEGIKLSISRKTEPSSEVLAAPVVCAAQSPRTEGPLVVLVPSDTMGRGDDVLGGILIKGFLFTLNEVGPVPDTIIFLNSGVKLVAEGSPALEDLEKLSRRGVKILACGTCLSHFGLKEKLAVGEVSNMYSIAETLLGAAKTVQI